MNLKNTTEHSRFNTKHLNVWVGVRAFYPNRHSEAESAH